MKAVELWCLETFERKKKGEKKSSSILNHTHNIAKCQICRILRKIGCFWKHPNLYKNKVWRCFSVGQAHFLTAGYLLPGFFADGFLAAGVLAAVFLAVGFLTRGSLAVGILAAFFFGLFGLAAFLAAGYMAAVFLGSGSFLTSGSLAVGILAAFFFGLFGLAAFLAAGYMAAVFLGSELLNKRFLGCWHLGSLLFGPLCLGGLLGSRLLGGWFLSYLANWLLVNLLFELLFYHRTVIFVFRCVLNHSKKKLRKWSNKLIFFFE